MAILVTGASGFVGCALIEELVAEDRNVVALDRIPPPRGFPEALGAERSQVTFVVADVCDDETLGRAMRAQPIEAVVHAATVTANAERDAAAPATILRVNVEGAAHVLQACHASGVRRLVQVSSNAAYGAAVFGPNPLEEDAVRCDPRSMYEITKFASERVALRLGDLHGVDVRVGRLSSVFGPWERATGVRDTLSPMLQLLLAARRGEEGVLARPCYRDWIYCRDAARALLALLGIDEPQAPRVFNIGPGPENRWPALAWGQKLQEIFPDFRCRLAEAGEVATIALHQEADRAPLAVDRLRAFTGFVPRFLLDAAFADYREWYARRGATFLDG